MKLISVSIENFGKLSHFDMNFNNGFNKLVKENGWGKSTLAAFIRVMFFGFEGEKKRDDLVAERQRYKPWQGDTYGGKLVFELDNKSYEISRVFATKEKDDIFELRDLDTNMISEDFSSNIGEELFGINSDSFRRTIFIAQNDCITNSTGDINAKLGNLSDATDDINNFEKVNKMLGDLINGMSPRRKTGAVSKIKTGMEELVVSIKEKGNIEKSISDLNSLKDSEKDLLEKTINEKNVLTAKKKELLKLTDLKVKRDTINSLKKEIFDREKEKKVASECFVKEIPVMDELDSYIEKSILEKQTKNNMALYSLSETEEERLKAISAKYEDGLPKKYEVAEMLDGYKELRDIEFDIAKTMLSDSEEEKYEKYTIKYGEKGITNEDVDSNIVLVSDIRKLEADENILNNKMQLFWASAREERDRAIKENKKDKVFMLLVLFGIVTAMFGVISMIAGMFESKAMSIACIAFGMIFIIVFSIMKFFNKLNSNIKSDIKEREYENDKNQLESLSKEIESKKNTLFMFATAIGINCKNLDEMVALFYEAKGELAEYNKLCEKKKIQNNSGLLEKRKEVESVLRKFVYKFGYANCEENADYQKILEEIKEEIYEYDNISSKKEKYDDLKNKHEVLIDEILKYVERIDSCGKESEIYEKLVEIKSKLSNLDSSILELDRAKSRYDEYMKDVSKDEEIQIEQLLKDEENTSDVDDELDVCINKINEIHSRINEYDRQLEKYYEQLDDISSSEKDYEDLKSSYDNMMVKLKRLELTKELIEEAKNKMTAKYIGPLYKGFSKYFKLMTGKDAADYQMDVNTNITINEKGLRRDVKFYSAGYKDLIYICMRMAFVDSMYEKNKPFIILDDPFVNLDDEKTKYAMDFLKEVEKEYQIIYFTCHNSRSICKR